MQGGRGHAGRQQIAIWTFGALRAAAVEGDSRGESRHFQPSWARERHGDADLDVSHGKSEIADLMVVPLGIDSHRGLGAARLGTRDFAPEPAFSGRTRAAREARSMRSDIRRRGDRRIATDTASMHARYMHTCLFW